MTTWTELRNATAARLEAAGIAGGRVARSRYAPIVSDGTTHARVYLRSGQYRANGDPSTGIPSFDRTRRLVVSIIREAGAAEELDDDLDGDLDAVLDALFKSPDWVNLSEGVESVEVDYDAKDDGEYRSIEAVISIEVGDYVDYPPDVQDDFETLAVRAHEPVDDDPFNPGADINLPQD